MVPLSSRLALTFRKARGRSRRSLWNIGSRPWRPTSRSCGQVTLWRIGANGIGIGQRRVCCRRSYRQMSMPMISTRDIGRGSGAIDCREARPSRIVELAGPEEYSPEDGL